jgi:glycosyltransferase involved in cell wall biosynthesis
LKVLHTFTLSSPDNAFGGPIRVALNLGHELQSRALTVELLGGCRGYQNPPTEIEAIPAHLFPVRQIHQSLGFSGLISAKLIVWAWRNVKKFDLVHIHMARDLVSLPVGLICRLRKVPYVIQGHGMIDPTEKTAGRLLDKFFVRSLLRNANRLLYLTEQEAKDYPAVAGSDLTNLIFLPNGVPRQNDASAELRPNVSFISRLQARKRPQVFVEMANELITAKVHEKFKIAGADEGELAAVLSKIEELKVSENVEYLGSQDHAGVIELLNQSCILVLPSVNEPFPMIVLEAISCAIPVVITQTCGLAPYITRGNAGIVTDGSVAELTGAVQKILSNLPEFSRNALTLSQSEFSMQHIGDELVEIYNAATASNR